MNTRRCKRISFRRYLSDVFNVIYADMYCVDGEMAMHQVLQACVWLLPGWRAGKTFLVTACRSSLDEMQGIIGVPNGLALAEKSQDLKGEQALALKLLPETWCEPRRLDQLRANAGSGVFVVEKYGAEQGITTPHDWL